MQINIDADILLFKAGACNQSITDWEDGTTSESLDLDSAKASFRDRISYILKATTGNPDADNYMLAFSLGKNFRYDLYADYKSNRPSTPEIVNILKQWALQEYAHKILPNPSKMFTLEADDILGLHQNDNTILVSDDKDLKQIEGLHWNSRRKEVHYITWAEADSWHVQQTLMGDSTDGYKGCPGIGKEKAKSVSRGEIISCWRTVLHHFRMVGLTDAEALTQARLAKIFDRRMSPDKLWEFPKVPENPDLGYTTHCKVLSIIESSKKGKPQ